MQVKRPCEMPDFIMPCFKRSAQGTPYHISCAKPPASWPWQWHDTIVSGIYLEEGFWRQNQETEAQAIPWRQYTGAPVPRTVGELARRLALPFTVANIC